MPLEGIITWLIAAVIIIVILVLLVHLLGHVFFILPEAGLTHPGIHQFTNYGDLSMDKTGDLLSHGAPIMHTT